MVKGSANFETRIGSRYLVQPGRRWNHRDNVANNCKVQSRLLAGSVVARRFVAVGVSGVKFGCPTLTGVAGIYNQLKKAPLRGWDRRTGGPFSGRYGAKSE